MNPARALPFMVALACVGAAAIGASAAETFAKNTSYFNNEYGFSKSSHDVKSYRFLHPAFGPTDLEEEFSVRVYQRERDELEIEAVFRSRDMKLAAVTFRRPRAWEAEELAAMLAAFGGRWRELAPLSFVSSEGVRAVYQAGVLYMVSSLTLGTIERREEERRRAAEKKS